MIDYAATQARQAVQPVIISIIIATYNARRILADCLRSIEVNPPKVSYEIIVVDDCSKDSTSEMVRTEFPYVLLLRNETNQQYGYSNNRAIEHARGEYLFLLNNDTIVLPDALDEMLVLLRTRPDAGCVGCKLLNEDGSVQWSVKSLPNIGSAFFGARSILTRLFPNNPFSRQHLQHLTSDMKTPFAARYVSGAAVLIPRFIVDRIGGLDPRLFYHVDADYSKRIEDIGYKSYYLPTASIVHLEHKGGTMVSLARRFRSLVEFHHSSYIYYQKHMQKSFWSPMHAVVVVGLTARFLVSVACRVCIELVAKVRQPLR